jgi:hypothetical protein
MRLVVLYTLYWLYCSLQRAANIQYAWIDVCLRRVVPVGGRRQQRAFFIPTQLYFDLILGFAGTLIAQQTKDTNSLRVALLHRSYRFGLAPEHVIRLSWTKTSSHSSTGCNVEPVKLSHGVQSTVNTTRRTPATMSTMNMIRRRLTTAKRMCTETRTWFRSTGMVRKYPRSRINTLLTKLNRYHHSSIP